MADEYDDGSAEVFTAVVAVIVLIAVTTYLFYAGVIHDLKTGGIAAGILIVYVALCHFIAPYVIAFGPRKSQSGYDPGNFAERSMLGGYKTPTNQRISPAGYLFAVLMPGYFIAQSIGWLWGLIFRGGGETKKKR